MQVDYLVDNAAVTLSSMHNAVALLKHIVVDQRELALCYNSQIISTEKHLIKRFKPIDDQYLISPLLEKSLKMQQRSNYVTTSIGTICMKILSQDLE